MAPVERAIIGLAVAVIAIIAGVLLILAPDPGDAWLERLSVCLGVFMIAAGIYMGARLIAGPGRNRRGPT